MLLYLVDQQRQVWMVPDHKPGFLVVPVGQDDLQDRDNPFHRDNHLSLVHLADPEYQVALCPPSCLSYWRRQDNLAHQELLELQLYQVDQERPFQCFTSDLTFS